MLSAAFKVSKKDDENEICDVRYANVSRQKLDTFFNDIDDVVDFYIPICDMVKKYTFHKW